MTLPTIGERLRMVRGKMTDKYGRAFEFNPEALKKACKQKRAWPSYHAHQPTKGK